MSITNQELKCLKCGNKGDHITRYKQNLPICTTCQKGFSNWHKGSKVALIVFIFTCVATGITLFLLLMLSLMEKYNFGDPSEGIDSNYLMVLGWVQIALAFTIVFLVVTVAVLILRWKFGINPKGFLKSENGNIFIKSEKDKEWTAYQTWMKQSLDESVISEEVKQQIIGKETEAQKAVIKSNYKKGVGMFRGGMCLFIFGLVSLIYGLIVTLPAGFPIGTTAFYTVHLPASLPPMVVGLVLIIVGIRKKKT